MSLNGYACGTAIFNTLSGAGYIADDSGDAEFIMQIICDEIFKHIEANDLHIHVDSEGGPTSPPVY